MKEFSLPVHVYYEDTDVAGVVYHANYLKFMERGRTEWLRELGLDQHLLIDEGIAFAVVAAELRYLKPARFNDPLLVLTRIVAFRRAQVEFEQRIVAAGDTHCVYSTGRIRVACVTLTTMKPRALPGVLIEELKRDA